jgi:hypothetical protein
MRNTAIASTHHCMGLYQRSAPGSERYGPALPVCLPVYNKHLVVNSLVGVHILKYPWFALV